MMVFIEVPISHCYNPLGTPAVIHWHPGITLICCPKVSNAGKANVRLLPKLMLRRFASRSSIGIDIISNCNFWFKLHRSKVNNIAPKLDALALACRHIAAMTRSVSGCAVIPGRRAVLPENDFTFASK